MKEDLMSRKRLVRIALGRDFADVVVRGGRVVDVYTGEIRRADVAVGDGRIAAVGQVPAAAIDRGRKSSRERDCLSLRV
jgi:adenine deaminase